VWRTHAPLKVKIMLWLAIENRILTWDNGMKRGWTGPSRCALCKDDSESVQHLFISCHYAQQVCHRF
jgi:hypothetical protein